MPPQNMPCWRKDYFELKALEKKQIKKSSLHSPIWLKAGCKFVEMSPFLSRVPSPLYQRKFQTQSSSEIDPEETT